MSIFTTIISQPLYNGLIFLMKLIPNADAGMIVVIFTVIIKLILLPPSIHASKSQLQMKQAEKDLNAIKEKYKDKEEQAKKTLEYYREHGINPFVSIFILLIQLPIIIGLYRIFLHSGLPDINTSLLYHFVSAPSSVNMVFLGLINISSKSLILAVIAGITTFIQLALAQGPKSVGSGAQADIGRAMQTQMKFFFPILVVFISYTISAAIAIYWTTSNIFAIVQEEYIRRKYHKATLVI